MAAMIDTDLLTAVARRAGELMLNEASVAHLRREWPGIHFTLCSDDDVPARLNPVREGNGFKLYLVSNLSHCVSFTNQLEAASGIVLATDEADA
jgi:hypothetical protein